MPFSTTALLQEALALQRRGALAEAAGRYSEVLRADPDNTDAYYYLGMMACHAGHFDEGAELARKALARDPRHANAHILLGRALSALGRHEEAIKSLQQAIALAPDLAQAHSHLADVLNDLGRKVEAIQSYDRALALMPDCVEDWFNRGLALNAVGRREEALGSFERAIAAKPELALAHLERANVLWRLHRYDEALESIGKALVRDSDFAEAWHSRGVFLHDLGNYDGALAAYDKALALKPDLVEAWLGRGNALRACKRYEEAFTAYDKALALGSDLAKAWFAYGEAYAELGQYDNALAAYERALSLKPGLKSADGARLYAKTQLCDWTNIEKDIGQVLSLARDQKPVLPFNLLSIPSSALDQLRCAKAFIEDQGSFPALWNGEIYSHDRIRIAYLSADFHEHATAYLMTGLFEKHDKARFEVTAVSFGPNQNSHIRRRIVGAVEHFIDVGNKSDQQIAELIRSLEIDIVIDLKGFTYNARYNVLARRAAPVQVNYLGYPGTMGTDFMDYIIADPTIIPKEQFASYAECVVWLPDSYQVNDQQRPISEHSQTRRECGLPDNAFVYCCFNNPYKILPDIFDIWMRLLRSNENSVLWLFEGHPTAVANFLREAEKREVSADRLVFAPKILLPDHLARHRHVDLFLDTLPYNAHITASDAL